MQERLPKPGAQRAHVRPFPPEEGTVCDSDLGISAAQGQTLPDRKTQNCHCQGQGWDSVSREPGRGRQDRKHSLGNAGKHRSQPRFLHLATLCLAVTVVHGVLEVPSGGVPRGVQTGQGTGERAQGETRPRRPGRSRETGQEGPGHQGTGSRGPTQPMRGACGVCGILKAEAQ